MLLKKEEPAAEEKKSSDKPKKEGGKKAPAASSGANHEATLDKQQWLGGAMPSKADREAFDAILKSGQEPTDDTPNTLAWFTTMSCFSEEVRQSWN